MTAPSVAPCIEIRGGSSKIPQLRLYAYTHRVSVSIAQTRNWVGLLIFHLTMMIPRIRISNFSSTLSSEPGPFTYDKHTTLNVMFVYILLILCVFADIFRLYKNSVSSTGWSVCCCNVFGTVYQQTLETIPRYCSSSSSNYTSALLYLRQNNIFWNELTCLRL